MLQLHNKNLVSFYITCGALCIISGTTYSMSFTKKASCAPKLQKKKVRHFQCLKDNHNGWLQCSKNLLSAHQDDFAGTLKNCTCPAAAIRFLMCEFVQRGETAKVSEGLNIANLFTQTEIDNLKNIAQFKYENLQEWKYIEIFNQLDAYKPKEEKTTF